MNKLKTNIFNETITDKILNISIFIIVLATISFSVGRMFY